MTTKTSKEIYILLLAAVLLAACGSDDTESDVHPDASNAVIAMNASGTNFTPTTRAESIDSKNIINYAFDIWAFYDGDYYMGNSSTGVRFVHTTEATSTSAPDVTNTGYWDYGSGEVVKYWPNPTIDATGKLVPQTLNFFALCPSLKYINEQNAKQTSNDNRLFTYTPNVGTSSTSIAYTMSGNGNADGRMIDLLYGFVDASASPVHMVFKHALSQLVFKARLKDNTVKAKIKDVTLYNVYRRGTCSFTNNTPVWDVSKSDTRNIEAHSHDENGRVVGQEILTTEETDITGDDPLLLIPQTLTPASITTGTTAPVSGTTGAYLGVKIKVQKSDGTYMYGSTFEDNGDETFATLYVPLSLTMKPGKSYSIVFVITPDNTSASGAKPNASFPSVEITSSSLD